MGRLFVPGLSGPLDTEPARLLRATFDARLAVVAGAVVLVVALGVLLPPEGWGVLAGLALYPAIGVWILWGLHRHQPAYVMGMADAVTLARAILVCLLCGLAAHPTAPLAHSLDSRWIGVSIAGLILALDGLDGWVARRARRATAFGARFDTEVDAVFVLVLSILVWLDGRVDAWVLAIGLLRYGFVAVALIRPWLGRALPDSLRRKTICVIQGAALTVCLTPPVGTGLANVLAGTSLGLLTASFAVDLIWLHRHRKEKSHVSDPSPQRPSDPTPDGPAGHRGRVPRFRPGSPVAR